MKYAVARNLNEKTGVFRRYRANEICKITTNKTIYLVLGSGPHNFVTYLQEGGI